MRQKCSKTSMLIYILALAGKKQQQQQRVKQEKVHKLDMRLKIRRGKD